jgi:hypothetical protein
MRPRRAQTPILVRSDKAAAILARHARPGYSQAKIVEEALVARFPEDDTDLTLEERQRDLEAVLDTVRAPVSLTMAEFDALEYDEFGLCR